MELTYNINHLAVDICTKCQLKCISCSTSKGLIRHGFIKEGMMSYEAFKYIVDQNPEIQYYELSNWGEIFLNPDIIKIIEYAASNGKVLTCTNGTNFNYVPDSVLEALVKYKFLCLNLSIDGASQETYAIYRVNGDFNHVLRNIQRLNYYKELYKSPYPFLSWQFIIFGHNEHEIAKVKQLCTDLNMKFNPKLNHSEFSPIRDEESVKAQTGLNFTSRSEYKKVYKKEYKQPCFQCLFSPQINWNGDVLGCCVNKWSSLGNIHNSTLREIIDSERYQFMIKVLFGKAEVNDSIPCFHCPNIIKIKEQPLTLEGLKAYSQYVPAALK